MLGGFNPLRTSGYMKQVTWKKQRTSPSFFQSIENPQQKLSALNRETTPPTEHRNPKPVKPTPLSVMPPTEIASLQSRHAMFVYLLMLSYTTTRGYNLLIEHLESQNPDS